MRFVIFLFVFFCSFREAYASPPPESEVEAYDFLNEVHLGYSSLPLEADISSRYEKAMGRRTQAISRAHLVRIYGGGVLMNQLEKRKIVRFGLSLGFVWPEGYSFSDFFNLYLDGSFAAFLSPAGSPVAFFIGGSAGFMILGQRVIPGAYSSFTTLQDPRVVSRSIFVLPFAGLEIGLSARTSVVAELGYVYSPDFYDWKLAEQGKERFPVDSGDAQYERLKIRGLTPRFSLAVGW